MQAPGAASASPRFIALIVACAMFMAQLDSSVVLVALPQMALTFGVRPVDLSLGVTVYILSQAALLPSSSWIADRWGARRVFALALAGFTCASVLCGISETLTEFLCARVLQGAAAALMTPVARIILLQSAQKEDLVGVITISTVPMLVAPTLGPPVGGLIVTALSWPWIFFLNVPVGVGGVLLVLRFLRPSRPTRQKPFDWLGFALTALASAGVLLGLDELADRDGVWSRGFGWMLAGSGCGVLAFRHLTRHAHPVLSLAAVRVRTYAISTLEGGFLVRLPARALPFILPLVFQVALGYSALAAGFLLLALNGGDLMLKAITTRTLRRFGFRSVLLASTAAMLTTTLACVPFWTAGGYWIVFALLAISGMARSLLLSGLSTLAFADLAHEELGNASVLWNLVMQMSNALGVSLAAIALNLGALWLNDPAGHVSVRNGQIAMLLITLLGFTSLLSFGRLPAGAGSDVSGHRLHSPAQEPPPQAERE